MGEATAPPPPQSALRPHGRGIIFLRPKRNKQPRRDRPGSHNPYLIDLWTRSPFPPRSPPRNLISTVFVPLGACFNHDINGSASHPVTSS